MKRALALLLILLTTACSLGLPKEGDVRTYYVLQDEQLGEAEPADERFPLNLIVRDVISSSFVSSQRMVFGQDANTRGYYRFAFWVEAPTRALSSIIATRLQATEMFNSVVREGSGTLGDVQLNADLMQFYHDVSAQPGSVKMQLRVELVDLRRREVIGAKMFRVSVPVESYDAEGAADAFNAAVTQVVNDLVGWVAKALAQSSIAP